MRRKSLKTWSRLLSKPQSLYKEPPTGGFLLPTACIYPNYALMMLQLIEYDCIMNIKKRLSLAQIKRQALLMAGVPPKMYGQKKATQVVKSRKKALATRGHKHRNNDSVN